SILLPQEIDPDEAEAAIKNGIITIKLPKLDKEKVQKLKVKSE
ncbi:MAG TPA: Hsp20/alpha crystallin family protein, partial [Candidatus Campbellbacteria bacterium]|nr:Hsp20/alpha crystallin family protein [Candidatus Campbellbacteria bacterium]